MKRDHGGTPEALIDAGVNVNPLGPPESLDAVFARARELAGRYPEIDAISAREAWAGRLGVPCGQLLVGNGASELISLAIRAIAPRRVIIFDPCYSEYASAALAAGIELAHVPLDLAGDTWRTPLDALLIEGVAGQALGAGDLVVVGQPNNPTGHLTEIGSLLALVDSGAHVLTDESFLALVEGLSSSPPSPSSPGPTAHTLVPHVGGLVSVVTSLTKTYCVPGLRLGLLVGDETLVARISDLRDPWSVNGIAAQAAVTLAGDGDYLDRSRAQLASERARVALAVAALSGMRLTEGAAPWILAELLGPHTTSEVRARLLARGIAVRDASTFSGLGERWIRIGVRAPAENDAILTALGEILS
ncbi:MAG: pyridoxal phosphate-dependent aminotransferase [Thermoleophilia bacterium]